MPNGSLISKLYQRHIDSQLYSYKNDLMSKFEQYGMSDKIAEYEGLMQSEFSAHLRKEFNFNPVTESNKTLEYSGIYFGEKLKASKSETVRDFFSGKPHNNAVLFRKDDTAFLLAHGSPEGKIVFQGQEYLPQDLIEQMHSKKIIPDDIKQLYTINCYGGKQQSFISSKGVKVSSAHTSENPIMGASIRLSETNEDQMLMFSLSGGDFTDEAKRTLMQNDTPLEVIKTSEKINEEFHSSIVNPTEPIQVKSRSELYPNFKNIETLTDKEFEAFEAIQTKSRKELLEYFSNSEDLLKTYNWNIKDFKSDIIQKARGKIDFDLKNNSFEDELLRALNHNEFYEGTTKEQLGKLPESLKRFAKTEEAQLDVLNYIGNNTELKFSNIDDLSNANLPYFKDKQLSHGLFAFSTQEHGKFRDSSLSTNEIIEKNLDTIVSRKDIQISTASDVYKIGPIGVTGTGEVLANYPNDANSSGEFFFGSRAHGGVKDAKGKLDDILEHWERNPNKFYFDGAKPWDEQFTKNFQIDSLWVKEDFYSENKDFVHSLMQKYKIDNLDLVHQTGDKIDSSKIERLNLKDLTESKKLTSQEAFDKYGPDDDRFYTSQGLDPKQQKEKIQDLNSKRKPPEPLPDYSADDARLDKILAEDKAYLDNLDKQKSTKTSEKIIEKSNESVQQETKPIKEIKKEAKPQSQITKPPKNVTKDAVKNSLPKKTISGGGKLAIAASIIVGAAVLANNSSNKKKDKEKEKPKKLRESVNSYNGSDYLLQNSNAMQMAQDISTYRYGKHMNGFVNV